VKLFDFGLAREYHPSKADKNGCFKMTGDTGSTRYMAPEVYFEKPYNRNVDVYSFGILFYQILALTTPFEGLTVKSFPKLVFQKEARPSPDPKWPLGITNLMIRCWSTKISERPSMEEVSDVLLKEILDITDEEVLDIMDASRKSELALRGSERSYRPVDAAVVAKDIEKITKKVVAIKITTENEDLDC
jgi:serine/threonine protein kinase